MQLKYGLLYDIAEKKHDNPINGEPSCVQHVIEDLIQAKMANNFTLE
jgi:hypothetical protein